MLKLQVHIEISDEPIFTHTDMSYASFRNGVLFYYITSGKLDYLMGNKIIHLKPFQFLLIPVEFWEYITFDANQSQTEGMVIYFSIDTINILLRNDNSNIQGNRFLEIESSLVWPNPLLQNQLHWIVRNKIDKVPPHLAHFIIHSLVFENFRHQNLLRKLDCSKVTTSKDILSKLIKARTFIDTNYSTNISLDELSNNVGMSKYHFVRQFKIVFKETPIERLINNRIRQSKILLKSSNLSISEIAKRTGFANLYYFSNTFKKQNGISPSQYRLTQEA